MSEVLTGSPAGTIYGTHAAALVYVDSQFGDAYRAWEDLDADDQQRTLLSAAAFLNRLSWTEDYDTFDERDALEAFQLASYELGVMIKADPSIITVADTGSNIQSVNAGGAGVSYFNPTSLKTGSATRLPPILMDLVGNYLAIVAAGGPDGGYGESGSCHNPFDSCADLDREDVY